MFIPEVIQTNITQIKQSPKLIGRIKLANFMELSEKEFATFVNNVENNPVFKMLAYPKNKKEKVISYRRMPHTGLSERFCELKEELVTDKSYIDIQHLLAKHEKVIQIIKKLGMDKFKRYFLYNEPSMTNEEISTLCGLEISAVKSINTLIDELSINSEFYYPSRFSSEEGIRYFKIAAIERNNSGGFVIAFFSPDLAQGKYLINYDKLDNLKEEGFFSKKEIKQIDKLLKQLETINSRKTILQKVIQQIIKHQHKFLKSSRIDALKPLSQKTISAEINVNPSLVCRAISRRSIDTPWHEEMPLRKFFLSNKGIRKNLIKEIILTEKQPCKDAEIRDLLKKRYRVDVSTHLVTISRNELKISSTRKPCNHRDTETQRKIRRLED